MQIKYINLFIIIASVSLLTGCGELINSFLNNKFPFNPNNSGNKITIHSNISSETVMLVNGTYISEKCQRSRFNSDYNKISYLDTKKEVEFYNVNTGKSEKFISALPINGGGWCDWKLTGIEISVTPFNDNGTSRTYISIPVKDNEHYKVKYSLTMAPVMYTSIKGPATLYSISKHEKKNISNRENGEIYFNYTIDKDLATTISEEKVIIFPNGDTQPANTDAYSNFVKFEEIIKHSDKKEITSYSEYID